MVLAHILISLCLGLHWIQADGYGVMAWAAGTRFEGMWRENKRSGFGRFFYPDGVTYEGQWYGDTEASHAMYLHQ